MSLPIDPTLSIEALETAIENHGYRITETETDYPLYGWRNGTEGNDCDFLTRREAVMDVLSIINDD